MVQNFITSIYKINAVEVEPIKKNYENCYL